MSPEQWGGPLVLLVVLFIFTGVWFWERRHRTWDWRAAVVPTAAVIGTVWFGVTLTMGWVADLWPTLVLFLLILVPEVAYLRELKRRAVPRPRPPIADLMRASLWGLPVAVILIGVMQLLRAPDHVFRLSEFGPHFTDPEFALWHRIGDIESKALLLGMLVAWAYVWLREQRRVGFSKVSAVVGTFAALGLAWIVYAVLGGARMGVFVPMLLIYLPVLQAATDALRGKAWWPYAVIAGGGVALMGWLVASGQVT